MSAFSVVLLAIIAVPRICAAAVVVAEPTGDADPSFLAELKASLEIVAAEAPAEMSADLHSSVSNNEAGWELVVELVPKDGKEPIRETRIVSKASALSQARAMVRAGINVHSSGVLTVKPIAEPTAEPAPEPAT